MNGNLSCFGSEHLAFNADDIAHIQLFKILVRLFSQTVSRHIGLDHAFQILHMTKRSLSHYTFGHHTSRHCNCLVFQLLKMIFNILAVM